MTDNDTTKSPDHTGAPVSPSVAKDRAELQEVLAISPIFRWLSEKHIDALLRTARIEQLPAGRMVGTEGEQANRLHLILRGDVDAFWGQALREVIFTLTRGGVFGGGLVLGEPNLYSFATSRETLTASWDEDSLRRAEFLAPGLQFQLQVRLSKTKRLGEFAEILQHAPLFRGSSSVLRHRLLQEMTLLEFPEGMAIYKAGEPANACYLVVRGEVEVKQAATDGRQPERLVIVGRGALIGDTDLFRSGERTESAHSISDTEVLAIDRIDIEALRRACGSFRRAIASRVESTASSPPQDLILVVNRTPYSTRSVATLIQSAFSDAGERGVEILEIAPEGTKTVGEGALLLPSEPERAMQVLEERARRTGSRYLVLYPAIKNAIEWLTEPVWDKIMDHRISAAVYFTDDLRHAFPIETPQLSPVQFVEVRSPHDKSESPVVRSGSIRLIIDNPLGSEVRYESLSPTHRAALQRLARTLSHQAVGVALGGGSAWGYAHIALLRALHDAGIPIDMVAGTSMGSVVACAYGSRQLDGLDTLLRRAPELAARISVAPITRKPVESFIEKKLLAHINLQDMPLPTFPVAVDIQTGRARVFRHGRAAHAMFASTAMPALFVPEIRDGVRFVDGGIVNNVPVSVLVEEGADFIIASNVIPPPRRMPREAHKSNITRILSQLNPLGRTRDGLRSMFLMMHEAGTRQATAAQVTWSPSVGEFGLFDIHAAKQIVEYVQPALPRFIEMVKERYRAFCRNRD